MAGWEGFGAGALGAAVGVGGAVASGIGAKAARGWQRRERERAQDWNLELDNTKYQRGMTDMRKAGLNPILMSSGGMGAGSTGANTPGASAAGFNASQGVSTGAQVASAGMAIRQMGTQNKILKENLAEAGYRASGALQMNTMRGPDVTHAVWRNNWLRGLRNTGNSADGNEFMKHKMYMDAYGGAAGTAVKAVSQFIPGAGAARFLTGKFK